MTTALEGRLFIGGEDAPDDALERVEHVNPANGRVQGPVPVARTDEIGRAGPAARRAAGPWRGLAASQRRDILLAVAAEFTAAADEMAGTAMAENGTPRQLATQLASVSPAAWFRYFAGWPVAAKG
jgi:aldehyde dehydrogenase (NAD+)